MQRDGSKNLPIDATRETIINAFAAWGSSVLCRDGGEASILFSQLEDVECRKIEVNRDQPNANVVLFQDDKWTYSGVDNTLAKTTVTFDKDTGEIVDADLEVNHANNDFFIGDTPPDRTYDLLAVLTHEVGHFIGMDHSTVEGATMESRYDSGSIKQRTLEPDDLAALCSAYPPSRSATCDPAPLNGFTAKCATEEAALGDNLSGCNCALIGREAEGGASRRWLGLIALAAWAVARRSARR